MKKVFALILACLMMMGALPVISLAAGETWNYTLENGVLTVTGTGDLVPHDGLPASQANYPWHANRGEITKIVVSDGITSIGREAFCHMTALTEAELGADCHVLRSDSFSFCSKLATFVFKGMITTIEQGSVYGTSSIQTVVLTGQSENYFKYVAAKNQYNTNFNKATFTISDNFDETEYFTYDEATDTLVMKKNCNLNYAPWEYRKSTVKKVILDDSVTATRAIGFANCPNLTEFTGGLGLSTLSGDSFSSCPKLTTITFKAPIREMGQGVVYNTMNLQTVVLTGQNETHFKYVASKYNYNTNFNRATFTVSDNFDETEYFSYDETTDTLVMKKNCYLNYTPWEYRKSTVKKVILDDSVTITRAGGFAFCPNLTEFTGGLGLTTLSSDSFANCPSLATVTFKVPVREMEQGVAYNTKNIKNIYLTNQTFPEFKAVGTVKNYNFKDKGGITTGFDTATYTELKTEDSLVILKPWNNGWENFNEQTQLLVQVFDKNNQPMTAESDFWVNRAAYTWKLSINGVEYEIAPSSYYLDATRSLFRFEVAKNEVFVPTGNTEYVVGLKVLNGDAVVYEAKNTVTTKTPENFIPIHNHTWTDHQVIIAPTVYAEGLGSCRCSVCNGTVGYTIPKITAKAGDINMDGLVTIEDVTTVLNFLASSIIDQENAIVEKTIHVEALDVDGDGFYTISDVTRLLNVLAGVPGVEAVLKPAA